MKLKHALAAVAVLVSAATANAAEFWTYIPGNGQLSVNNPGGGAGFAAVSVTGYTGTGSQFNGNFWDTGTRPVDSFFRFFCAELGQVAISGPNPYAMITAGEKLSSVTDMMTGEVPGQNTKATVAITAIEQGMKVFNAIYKRIHRSLKQEFKKIYDLNARYLPPIGYFNMLGVNAAAPISRGDYQVGDIDVMPYSDPNIATEAQKVSKLELLMPLLQMGTIDPMEFTMRYLEAIEHPNMDKLLAKPQGPSPEAQKIQAELQLKDKDITGKQQIEMLKVQVMDKLATAKVSKDEIDSVVALMELALSQQQAKQEVQASKMEASKTDGHGGVVVGHAVPAADAAAARCGDVADRARDAWRQASSKRVTSDSPATHRTAS